MRIKHVVKEFEGQKKAINTALGDSLNRESQEIFTDPGRVTAYWYGRLVAVEEILRFLAQLDDEPPALPSILPPAGRTAE